MPNSSSWAQAPLTTGQSESEPMMTATFFMKILLWAYKVKRSRPPRVCGQPVLLSGQIWTQWGCGDGSPDGQVGDAPRQPPLFQMVSSILAKGNREIKAFPHFRRLIQSFGAGEGRPRRNAQNNPVASRMPDTWAARPAQEDCRASSRRRRGKEGSSPKALLHRRRKPGPS